MVVGVEPQELEEEEEVMVGVESQELEEEEEVMVGVESQELEEEEEVMVGVESQELEEKEDVVEEPADKVIPNIFILHLRGHTWAGSFWLSGEI